MCNEIPRFMMELTVELQRFQSGGGINIADWLQVENPVFPFINYKAPGTPYWIGGRDGNRTPSGKICYSQFSIL